MVICATVPTNVQILTKEKDIALQQDQNSPMSTRSTSRPSYNFSREKECLPMSPLGNQVFGWKGKFRWWVWSSWHGKIGLLNWTGGLHNWDASEQVDQWYEGETRECRLLAGTHSMAKLDFWLEKAGTSATDPRHHWLVYPTLLQCVHQRILIAAPQLTQHNYHLYLLNPQGTTAQQKHDSEANSLGHFIPYAVPKVKFISVIRGMPIAMAPFTNHPLAPWGPQPSLCIVFVA